jgi:hypothetical protein
MLGEDGEEEGGSGVKRVQERYVPVLLIHVSLVFVRYFPTFLRPRTFHP